MHRRVGTEQPTDVVGTTLQIYLLGPPVVKWSGSPLAIPRRQVRAFLYRMAAETHPLPREHLCYLFWPDTPESTARRNLTCLMSHLRRALPTPDLVVTSDDRIWLAPDRIWSDTATFKRLCESPEAHARDMALQQAIDLHRGPFLNGFSLPHNPEFEMWVTLERQAWERSYLETLATLIEEQTMKGKYDAAIASAQRYLVTDDLVEDTHRRLIELYAAIGERNAAMCQFERCVTVLERELGVTPLPETQAAYRAVLEGQPPPRIAPLARPAWTTLPGLDVPLVGRDGVLRQLEKAFFRARAARGSIVLISGEAGIGKSRLIQDFATHLQGQAQVLTGSGYPDAQTMPYQPLVEALHPALRTRHSLVDVQPIWLAEASRLMPELRTLHPNLPPPMPTEPDQARTRLFEALCRLSLGLAAGPHPTILCLDDLHWADSTTLDWLAYLGRRLVGTRLLIVGTYRSEEASAMTELRHSLMRQGVVSEFEVEGLGSAEILQILRHLGGAVPNDRVLADRLRQATGGNPFFLLETLRVLLETDQRVEELAIVKDLPLPDTVRDAIEARVGRLSPQARQVLEASAVLGQTCTFDLVHLTAGRREMETIDGLDELVARQLLTEQTTGYRFRHEIIRAVIYHELGYWRRRVLHRRAGEALEKLQVDNTTALARHFERAEESGRAARYALQAGQSAKAVFGHTEACAYFDRTLALLEQEAAYLQEPEAIAANRQLRIHALDERGWALRLLGDMKAYVHDLQEEARLALLLGDPRTLAHLRHRQAYVHRWFCRYAQARKAAQEGLHLSQAAADRRLEARCQREIGLATRETGDYQQARMVLEQALALFVELDETVYEIHVMGNLSTLYYYMGEHEKTMNLASQTLARCDEAELPYHRRLPLGDMGAAAAAMGDTNLARQCLTESLSIARQIADRTQEILCRGHLGWLCVKQKKQAEALEHLQAALALAESIGSGTELSWLLSGLAEAHRLDNNMAQATAHAHRALELAQANGRVHDQGIARQILDRLGKADL